MIILLYGPDTFRARQKLTEIVEHYQRVHKTGLNLRYFNAHTDNLQEIIDWLRQSPMFQEKKMAVVKNLFQSADNKEKVKEHISYLENSENIVVFFEETDIENEIIPGVKKQKFNFLEGQALRKWIKNQLKKFSVEADWAAIERLIYFVGSNSWQLANEIKKLASYTRQKRISVKDVELLVRPKIETDIFKTVRALAFKDKRKALILIHQHLEKGDSPIFLLAMKTWQFRKLLSERKNTLFTYEELKRIYRKILETEINIKTGKIDPETALYLLITEI